MKNAVLFACGLVAVVLGQINGTNAARRPRVINGEDTRLGERPYQVSLQKDGDHFCGGSIINEYWIVTAAHCLIGRYWTIDVFAGIINNTRPDGGRKVVEKIIHEAFYLGSLRDDIALLKVDTPFEFSSTVGKVNLPEPNAKFENYSPVVVSGWGLTHDLAFIINHEESFPDILQKATLYIIDSKECEAAVQKVNLHIFPDVHICAKSLGVMRGHCYADSGGPVTSNGVLVGIVSWSWKREGCGNPKYPDVYTRVSEYVGWIRKHIEEKNNETIVSNKL